MNVILSSARLRWLGHSTLLVIAFVAGKHSAFKAPPAAAALPSPPLTQAHSVHKDRAPSAVAENVDTDVSTKAQAPVAVAAPMSRLAQLINVTSHLSEPQTLAALHKLDLLAPGVEARLQRHVLLGRFAELDPETALTYVDTLSGTERDEQMTNVLSTWASRDPAAASAHFQSTALSGGLASSEDRETAASIASEWARKDPAAALGWAAALPEEVRSEARSRIIASIAATNPTLAAQTVTTLPAGYERAEAMQPLASQWAQSSPAQAASWVQSLSNISEQASAASGLVSSWMNTDPMAASQWISNLKPGSVRDAAVASLVQAPSLRNDPEAATLWAASVQDISLREQLVQETSRRWQLQDAAAASTCLQFNAP